MSKHSFEIKIYNENLLDAEQQAKVLEQIKLIYSKLEAAYSEGA